LITPSEVVRMTTGDVSLVFSDAAEQPGRRMKRETTRIPNEASNFVAGSVAEAGADAPTRRPEKSR
jgi:hypothetical protein